MEKKVSIVGFGRFGKTLVTLLKGDFDITVLVRSQKSEQEKIDSVRFVTNISDAYQSDVIFFAVPISEFEKVIEEHSRYFEDRHVLIDVLSVKLHPKSVFEKYVKGKTQAILSHPMFGPDSSKNGFENLPMILNKFKSTDESYAFWKKYFESKKLKVIEMTADEHDKIAANSQGLTHFIGRVLEELKIEETAIDSLGTKKLLEIKEQTCNDTWQLFTDLQQYNPYTKEMRLNLGNAYDKLYNKLLPKQLNKEFVTYGIQGGRGSFNEEALLYFTKRSQEKKYEVKYLHTTQKVLEALHKGEIDRGQFAIHNSVGGVVEESIMAMASYKFAIIDQFAIKISHALMMRADAKFSDITTIMSHPQVFAQCKESLSKKYPHLKLESGEGELIDHAKVAKLLSEGKLPKNIATMGSKVLADLYKLTVIEENLEDMKENYTSFLQVARI